MNIHIEGSWPIPAIITAVWLAWLIRELTRSRNIGDLGAAIGEGISGLLALLTAIPILAMWIIWLVWRLCGGV